MMLSETSAESLEERGDGQRGTKAGAYLGGEVSFWKSRELKNVGCEWAQSVGVRLNDCSKAKQLMLL